MRAKTIDFKPDKSDLFPDKISLEVMREIWDEPGKVHSDEQLLQLREFVYFLLETIHKEIKKVKQRHYVTLNSNSHGTEKSDFICEGEYRRAS